MRPPLGLLLLLLPLPGTSLAPPPSPPTSHPLGSQIAFLLDLRNTSLDPSFAISFIEDDLHLPAAVHGTISDSGDSNAISLTTSGRKRWGVSSVPPAHSFVAPAHGPPIAALDAIDSNKSLICAAREADFLDVALPLVRGEAAALVRCDSAEEIMSTFISLSTSGLEGVEDEATGLLLASGGGAAETRKFGLAIRLDAGLWRVASTLFVGEGRAEEDEEGGFARPEAPSTSERSGT